jgi:phosphorylcholine metabolism protein LicD
MNKSERIKSTLTKNVYDILVKNEVKCFLTGGALLGAYRNKGKLPDDDYFGGNFNVIENEIKPKYKSIEKDLNDIGISCKRGISNRTFTVFVGAKPYRSEIISYFKKEDCYYRKSRYLKIIPLEFFENPFTEIKFLGHIYPAPYDIEKYLVWLYGNWKRPNNSKIEKKYKSLNHIKG